MADKSQRLKFIFGANTKDLQQDVNQGKVAVQQFASQGTSAIDRFAQSFGVNTYAIRGTLNQTKSSLTGMSRGFKSAAGASGALSAALKILKFALISTGIGAIVVALGSLMTFFTKTQRGADKFKQALAGVKAVIDVLIDRIALFGEGIYLFSKGNFQEGWEKIKESVQGLGKELKEESKLAVELEKRHQALQDREIALTTSIAERRNKIAELILTTRDETKAAEERRKAVVEANEVEKSIMNDELALQKERVAIMQAQLDLGESSREDIKALADEKAKLLDIESQSITRQRELANRYNELTNKIVAQTTALRKKYEQENKLLTSGLKPIKQEAAPIDSKTLRPMQLAQENAESMAETYAKMGRVMVDVNQVIEESMEQVTIGLASWMGELAAGTGSLAGFKTVIAATFGDMAVQVGKIAIQTGLTVKGIKLALESMRWELALAAGIALVALGSYVKSSLSSAASGMGGGSMAGSSIGSSGGSFNFDTRSNSISGKQKIEIDLTGEFEVAGNKLVRTINNENARIRLLT